MPQQDIEARLDPHARITDVVYFSDVQTWQVRVRVHGHVWCNRRVAIDLFPLIHQDGRDLYGSFGTTYACEGGDDCYAWSFESTFSSYPDNVQRPHVGPAHLRVDADTNETGHENNDQDIVERDITLREELSPSGP